MRSVALHSVKVYDRSYVLAIFSVAYATLAAMQQQGVRADSVLALVAAPLALAWVWQKTRLVERLSGNVHPTALAAVRYSTQAAAPAATRSRSRRAALRCTASTHRPR